ncbi:MAG: hypothetical protein IJV36_04800 [Prevotella sp.]|nr:hypothetical protein [Prevotella sp.]
MKWFRNVFWASVRGLTGAFLVLILVAALIALCGCDRGLRKENERLREELARQQQWVPLEREEFRESLEAVRQSIKPVEKVKAVLSDEDRRLLKDLGAKVKDIESLQKIGTMTEGSVNLSPSLPQGEEKDQSDSKSDEGRDSVLMYRDEWVDFSFHTNNRLLHFSLKDSLAIAIEREYKRKFLWLRWGMKGYRINVVNFNPHSRVKYNSYVKRE